MRTPRLRGRGALEVPVIEIHDPGDERIRDYTSLTDVALRRHREVDEGLFIAEGELVIARARRAGYQPRSLLVGPSRLAKVPADIGPDVPVYLAGPEVLEAVTGFRVHRGALASMRRRPVPPAAAVIAEARRVLVLEDVVNHTNVGAVFRSAAGLGMDALLLSPSCADPLYRRAVRVSMGEVFAIPYARCDPWPDGLGMLARAGFSLVAFTPTADAVPLEAVSLRAGEKAAVLLGSEGPGLTAAALGLATMRVRIPMAAGVDSLNIAAAAAIACYALGSRSRSGGAAAP
jgi:tRNA G18 (ribose-2'-O)-methylase SpoU